LAQYGVQRRHHRHMKVAQKSQHVASSRSAVDSKFVLNRDDFDVVDIQKVGSPAVGIELDLVNLKSDPGRIIIAFRMIIHCADDALAIRKFRGHGLANVSGEGRNAASTRKMVPNEGYLFNVAGI